MAARLGHRVQLNAEVVGIQHDASSVRVQVRRRTGQYLERSADFAVCALPVPCLRRVRVTPGFPSQTRAALAGMRTTSVTRVFLQLSRRCWPAGAVVMSDLPLMLLAEATADARAAHPVLEAFVTGAHARSLASLPESERIERVRNWAERIQPGVARAVLRGASYVWDHDRWAGGDYAWFAPGELTAFSRWLRQPHGRIHFAGDHTSSLPGWMEGALASGVRAAREVQEAWTHAR
jgi:monoamine oxidase